MTSARATSSRRSRRVGSVRFVALRVLIDLQFYALIDFVNGTDWLEINVPLAQLPREVFFRFIDVLPKTMSQVFL